MLKTENLVILFTDIAGFTEATSLQSREENRRILETHNALLLPIVKRFRGRHIKSIGDALLLVFRSPTDAMRCAMAMQDALHAYNRTAPHNEEIHIRIAASLGEVRVSKGDIFGEPVNVTSRIEGITPADEIYLSEAVYLAMNKAEVPAVEVGLQELKGISKPVRVYAIPRFASSQLVPDSAIVNDIDPSINFPYGGMHISAAPVASSWSEHFQKTSTQSIRQTKLLKWGIGTATLAIAVAAAVQFTTVSVDFGAKDAGANAPQPAPQEVAVKALSIAPQVPAVASSIPAAAPVAAQSPAAVAPAVAQSGSSQPLTAPVVAKAASVPHIAPAKPSITSIAQAKRAYRDARISKDRYREIVRALEDELDMYIRRAKIDYRDGRISKEMYRTRVESLKRRYEGE